MSTRRPTGEKPRNVKNFTTAFLILALLMIAAQVINFSVTLLPAAQEAIIDLGDGTTTTVAALQNSYLTLLIIVVLVYGATWFWVRRTKNWARWVAIVLAVLAALGGVQGLITVFAAGATDTVGLALSLAQVLASGWVLALAFRQDLHAWFRERTTEPPRP